MLYMKTIQGHYILSLSVKKCLYTNGPSGLLKRKVGYLDKLYTGGGFQDETILEQSRSNHGRKRTAGVVKRKKAGVENRTHCGVGEE